GEVASVISDEGKELVEPRELLDSHVGDPCASCQQFAHGTLDGTGGAAWVNTMPTVFDSCKERRAALQRAREAQAAPSQRGEGQVEQRPMPDSHGARSQPARRYHGDGALVPTFESGTERARRSCRRPGGQNDGGPRHFPCLASCFVMHTQSGHGTKAAVSSPPCTLQRRR